jgi:hypothetical protein
VQERRITPRQRTLKGARIVTNDGYSTLDCVVRNLSKAGAKLKVASSVGIPDAFDLVFDDGRKFACSVTWRKAEELGVTFS